MAKLEAIHLAEENGEGMALRSLHLLSVIAANNLCGNIHQNLTMADVKSIKLLKWTPKFKRGDYFSMLIFASRNSGKSYLIKHLLRTYLRSKYDIFIVVSDSGDTESDLGPVLPVGQTHFWNDMNYAAITMMEGQNKERTAEGKQPLSMLIIFDDKVSVHQRSDDRLMQLFTRGRHMHLSIIFSSQAKKFADTGFLNNADYVLLLKANSQQQRK